MCTVHLPAGERYAPLLREANYNHFGHLMFGFGVTFCHFAPPGILHPTGS
jgi:hypothetical protein